MKPKLVCAKCASDITKDDKFCPSCGQKIDWDYQVESKSEKKGAESEGSTEPQSLRLVCDVCGYENAGGQFCESCGARLIVGTVKPQRRGKASKGDKSRKARGGQVMPASAGGVITAGVGILLIGALAYIFVINRNSSNEHVHTTPSAPDQQMVMREIDRLAHELEHDPDNTDILLGLANLYHDVRDYPKAIAHYERYVSKNPSNPDARVDLGICFFEANQPDRAVETVRKVTEDFPGHQLAAFNLGIIFLNLGELDNANGYFKRAAEINPDNETGQRARRIVEEHSF